MSQPSQPDGSDPRILAPSDDEEQVIVKSAWGGNGKAYHTTECRNVEQMRSTREVAKSIAEWKGYHECEVCITEGEYNDDPAPEEQQSTGEQVHATPTTEECARFRRLILDGDSPADVAAQTDWGRTTVYRHANGNCKCTDVAHPPVTYGWHFDSDADDSGVLGSNNHRIASETCKAIRVRLVDGQTRKEVADAVGIDKSNIHRHAHGDCDHVHSNTPPVSHGWHEVDE